jgi:hypothetical protein
VGFINEVVSAPPESGVIDFYEEMALKRNYGRSQSEGEVKDAEDRGMLRRGYIQEERVRSVEVPAPIERGAVMMGCLIWELPRGT